MACVETKLNLCTSMALFKYDKSICPRVVMLTFRPGHTLELNRPANGREKMASSQQTTIAFYSL